MMAPAIRWLAAGNGDGGRDPEDDAGTLEDAVAERSAFLDALFDTDAGGQAIDGGRTLPVNRVRSAAGNEDAIVDQVIRELLVAQDVLRAAGLK